MPGFPLSSGERNPQQFVNAIRHTFQGHVDCVGVVTLATGSATTTVLAPTAGTGNQSGTVPGSMVWLFPQTAAAATEFVSGNLRVPMVTVPGQFTIFHTNSATANRTFSWVVLG